jgi:capsular exopolysaccharide synthesis family protein
LFLASTVTALMKKQAPPPPSSGNEGYGYGNYGSYGAYSGYYYGYGYGSGGYPGGGEPHPTRSLRDYALILRERIWYLIVTFFVIFTAFVLYALNKTPEYISSATVQVLRGPTQAIGGPENPEQMVTNLEDFNTRVRLMESAGVASAVADRLKDQERKNFLAPYENTFNLGPPPTVEQRLITGRDVEPIRMSLMIAVSFKHPDKEVAATIANYFAEEFINSNQRTNTATSMQLVEDLNLRAEQQRKKVEEIQGKMNDMIQKYGTESLDRQNNILGDSLKSQNQIVTEDDRFLDVAKERWDLIQQQRDAKKPLWDLSFIAEQPQVNQLISQYGAVQVQLANMLQKYGERHPDVIAAVQSKAKMEEELTAAVESAAQTIYTDFEAAQNNYDEAIAHRKDIEDKIMETSKLQVDYDTLNRDFDVAESMYKSILASVEEQQAKFAIEAPTYRIVDRAAPAGEPSEPKVMLLIAMGLVSGLISGVGMAFLVAFLDDRVKTAFDIESVVGLPLLGIVPRIRHLNSAEKAQAVASNTDRRVTESFRSIYSALKLNDAAKNARAILVTSTVPSEGKSFVTTNLALTYAVHGERVLVIDCDLRMPNVAKSMGVEQREVGLITHLVEHRSFEECVLRNAFPNLDLLTTGGKTRNPTQIFNSREFTDFMTQMRQQYDRIFIDSPPVGAVSDALNLLPAVDGVLYIIKFNAVKRKTAKLNLRRILEGNVPVFGAVLNQISLAVASYYYTSYYDKSYRNYYVHGEEREEEEEQDPRQPASARAETGEPQGTNKPN